MLATWDRLAQAYLPRSRPGIEAWGSRDVFFRSTSKHVAAIEGPYSLSSMPWYRGIQEAIQDSAIREVWVLKCTQSGGSENCLLMPLRYWVARDPAPTMYVSAQMEHTEAFVRERILSGFEFSSECRAALVRAQVIGTEIYFPEMPLFCTWSTSIGGAKSRPIQRLLLDEVSAFRDFGVDKFRMRLTAFPHSSKLVGISSQDAKANLSSDADPMVEAWKTTKQHEWEVRDPKTSRWFIPAFGCDFKTGRLGRHGVRWDPDWKARAGEWDIERVKAGAWYQCPSGAKIAPKDKWAWMEEGRWVGPRKFSERVGFRVSGLMSNFYGFGDLAARFLRAKADPRSLHVYVMEVLAEMWQGEVRRADESVLTACEADYVRGENWWLKEEATPATGGSALIDWGQAHSWDEMDKLATERFDAAYVLVDSGYGERTSEVYMACQGLQFIPTKGFSRQLTEPWTQRELNPAEGTRRGRESEKVTRIDFDTDLFKDLLHGLMTHEFPEPWMVPNDVDREYLRQITSEEKGPKGWVPKHKMNHLWDCEALQILAAMVFGLLRRPAIAAVAPERIEKPQTILTVDVQKDHFWWVARSWSQGVGA